MIMNAIEKSAQILAESCSGNPVLTTCVVILFYVLFGMLEATVEKLIYGERFEHWLDPFFIASFIAYSAYAVMACAIYNSSRL